MKAKTKIFFIALIYFFCFLSVASAYDGYSSNSDLYSSNSEIYHSTNNEISSNSELSSPTYQYPTYPKDTTAPVGTILINQGKPYCNSVYVSLSLTCTDDRSGVDQMSFSNNAKDWTLPQTYSSSKKWQLSSGDGKKTVYVKFKDKAGNWSKPYSDGIILDTQPPYFKLNPVIKLKNSKVQVLAGQKEYYASIFINGKEVIPTNTYNTWYYEYPLSIPENQISVTASDRAGNTAPTLIINPNQGIVTLDSEPPVITGLRIDPQTKDFIITIKDPAKVLSYNIYYADTLTTDTQTQAFRLAQSDYSVSGAGATEWRDNGTFTQIHPSNSTVRSRYYKLEVARIEENRSPQVGTIIPSSGASKPNQQITFTTTYSDPNGWQDIAEARFLINTLIDGKNCVYVRYDKNSDKLYLCKDNDLNEATRWLGGFSPGSANTIENSYGKLDCSKTAVLGSANTLTINWAITFKSTFLGVKNTYLRVRDTSDVYAGWSQKGTWEVTTNSLPKINSFNPLDYSTFITNDNINISVMASDQDNDPLEYRYLMDNIVVKDWTASSTHSFKTAIKDRGRHNIKVTVRDNKGGYDSKIINIFVFRAFPKPPDS